MLPTFRQSYPWGLHLLLVALPGCPAQKSMQVPPGQPAVLSSVPAGQSAEASAQKPQASREALRPDGAPCFEGSHCFSTVCEGASCDGGSPGTCVPENRICTRDLVEYCGCDGKTFLASSSCPGEAFTQKGKCAELQPMADQP